MLKSDPASLQIPSGVLRLPNSLDLEYSSASPDKDLHDLHAGYFVACTWALLSG